MDEAGRAALKASNPDLLKSLEKLESNITVAFNAALNAGTTEFTVAGDEKLGIKPIKVTGEDIVTRMKIGDFLVNPVDEKHLKAIK